MTDDIIAAVETQLKALYPSAVVCRHYCPQNFNAFLISITEASFGGLHKGMFAGKLSFDVQYFSGAKPDDIGAIRADCISVQETLFHGFDVIGRLRCVKKDAKITDNVLHFTFDVPYRERTTSADTSIGNLTINLEE